MGQYTKKMEIALFRYGIISDFINQAQFPKGKKQTMLEYKCQQEWKIPYSNRKRISKTTIRNWIRAYNQRGKTIESLYPLGRNDKNKSRVLTHKLENDIKHTVMNIEIKSVNDIIINLNRYDKVNISKATIYRFLHNNNMMKLLKRKKKIGYIDKRKKTDDEKWLLSLLQCKLSIDELKRDLSNKLAEEDIEIFYNCLLKGRLYYRKRVITILAKIKGIPKQTVSDYLFIPVTTQKGTIEMYQTDGANSIISDKWKIPKKHEDPKYIERVFSILHAPPSSYGFNRTSWRQKDIKQIMDESGMHVSKHTLRNIINAAGFKYKKARKVLTSHDPNYREKVDRIKDILGNLKPNEKFFSIDEYGPFAVIIQGGKSLVPHGTINLVPQWQKSKGSIIITASLELSTNQITHFYSENKNTDEMIKLLNILLKLYSNEECLYLSWDAASWHISKKLYTEVNKINAKKYNSDRKLPVIELAPLPTGAQFLNVIESVFSGMARAIIHNSDYKNVDTCKEAIDKYFSERNEKFIKNPKRAGNKIWKKERVLAKFNESNNCKDPMYR